MILKKILNLFKYLFYYFFNIKKKYSFSTQIQFGLNYNLYFRKKLEKSDFYLEFGSGSSTLLAKKLKKKFFSIETDKNFYLFMKSKLGHRFSKCIVYHDMGPTKYMGYPLLPSYLIKKKIFSYAEKIKNFKKIYKVMPDLILIDGRYRVFVTLMLIKYLNKEKKNIEIIIDDFYRKDYQILKKFIKINKFKRFGIIILNQKSIINTKLLEKYISINYKNKI